MKTLGFIHIPKCGGHYIESCCDFTKNNIRHLYHDAYKKQLITGWDSWKGNSLTNTFEFTGYETAIINEKIQNLFTVIRNPFDLLVSYYYHNNTNGWANCNLIHSFNSFKDFIEGYLDPDLKWHYPIIHKHVFGQLYNGKKLLVPTKNILRLETIDSDLKKFKKQYNLDIKTRPSKICNKGQSRPSKNYKEFYTLDQVTRLEGKFGDILTEFNYSF